MTTWRRPTQAPPKAGESDPDPEWTRGSLLAVWLLLPLLCRCLAVPSEIELTVELGADQVEVQASLRDIQLWTEDPVEALRIFHGVHAPEAARASEMLGHFPWRPQLSRWEWQVRGQALDLVIGGSMPRSQFDACVAMPLEQRGTSSAGRSPCHGFPLRLMEGAYRPAEEASPKGLGTPPWKLLGQTRWPARERRLQARVQVDVEGFFPPMRQSALPAFQLHASDPEAAASYTSLVQRYGAAFREGDTPACQTLQSEAERTLPARLLLLFHAQLRRERLWLLEAFMRQHGLLPVKSVPRPVELRFGNMEQEYAPSLLPRKPPPETGLLRLARLHDQAAVRFGVDWETGRRDFSSWMNESDLQVLCSELIRKAPAHRRLCKHLLDTRPPHP